MKTPMVALIVLICCVMTSTTAPAQTQKWAAAWAASAQGPYPTGNPSAQPILDFAFPVAAEGANDQAPAGGRQEARRGILATTAASAA